MTQDRYPYLSPYSGKAIPVGSIYLPKFVRLFALDLILAVDFIQLTARDSIQVGDDPRGLAGLSFPLPRYFAMWPVDRVPLNLPLAQAWWNRHGNDDGPLLEQV